jgi:hypothetical protein
MMSRRLVAIGMAILARAEPPMEGVYNPEFVHMVAVVMVSLMIQIHTMIRKLICY